MTLNFTPVVLSQGRIQLRIATEVTDVDYASQVTFQGISIPGFRTRNNVTTVELPSGGSIATAGLISTQTQQAINGLPGLMNLPILGALFRSRDYQRNETELMIIVTPYIVHAIDSSQVVRPDQNFEDASDPQACAAGAGQPDLFHVRIASTSAWLRREDRIRHSMKSSYAMTGTKVSRTDRANVRPAPANAIARRCAGVGMLAALACLQSGCMTDYASSEPAFPGDFQTRHAIALATAPSRLDVYPIGGALDARTVANLRSFAEQYRNFGSGEVVIFVPGHAGSDWRAVSEIRQVLRRSGLRARVGSGAYFPYGSGAAPIQVAFMSLKAEVRTPCGLWPEDLASGSSLEGWKNEPYENFGCATQSVVAAQVADPRDFVQARALGPSDVAMRTRAIEAVRKGQDPGTAWSTGLTPIGGTIQ